MKNEEVTTWAIKAIKIKLYSPFHKIGLWGNFCVVKTFIKLDA